MRNFLKQLLIPALLFILVCMSILCISGCDRDNTEETNDIGITYFSGNSEDESIVYTIESAYWNKQWSSFGQGESFPDWYLLIRIKIVNNTMDNYTPNNKLFTVYYQIPEINVDVSYYLYEMLPMGNGGYGSSSISYIKPGQTAYLSISGNHFNENPTLKYTENFYLVHKLQTSLGTETKTFNLGVLKED